MVTTIAGRYQLDPVHIGRGGMGEVWGATDTRLRRRVAVKFIHLPAGESDQQLVRRFLRESQLTARIDHPGVPVIYDADQVDDGPFDGRHYLVMQLIDGINVDDLVAEHDPLPIGWAVAIAAQTAAVLSYAHGKQLVHRDLKPSNLMLARSGTVKVLDFGLAVALDAAEVSRITLTNQLLGTLAYMAPEQFQNDSSVRSDFYALGCVLHRMLTGEQPFDGANQVAVMHSQLYEEPTPVRALRPDVPEGLEALVLELLAKKPDERPASADEIYTRLMPFLSTLGELPGVVEPGRSAARMYADVVGRMPVVPPSAARSLPAPRPRSEPAPISLGDVARARRQAERLMRESRYTEAVRVLTRVTEQAAPLLGTEHSDVVGLRSDLANALFSAGEYATAAEAYEKLSHDLARRDGDDADLALWMRYQAATCHAAGGDVDTALRRLGALLADERRVYGDGDKRVTGLREQIGLLLHGAGRTSEAVTVLTRLASDLAGRHGPDHADVREIQDMLRRMRA